MCKGFNFLGNKWNGYCWALAIQLCTEGVDLEQDDDAARVLGVHIKRNPETRFLKMTPICLIKWVLETLGLNVGTANGKITPAKGKPLIKHVHREPAFGDFNYSSVVWLLLNVAEHTCPNITYTVNCVARYTLFPKLVHKHALKQIGCYLKATSDKELITKPSEKLLKMDSLPGTDFAGIYGHKAMDNPVGIKSRICYVIVVNSPIKWKSKLQCEIAPPTMKAAILPLLITVVIYFP